MVRVVAGCLVLFKAVKTWANKASSQSWAFRGARRAHHHQLCEGFQRDCAPEGLSAPLGMTGAAAASPLMGMMAKMGFLVCLQLLAGGVCVWDGAQTFPGERCSPLTSCSERVGSLFPAPQINSSYTVVAAA